MVLGVGVGTVFGAALGVAWVLGYRNPMEEARQNRRAVASSLRPSITRSQLPKRHLKVRSIYNAFYTAWLGLKPCGSLLVTDTFLPSFCASISSSSQKITRYRMNLKPT